MKKLLTFAAILSFGFMEEANSLGNLIGTAANAFFQNTAATNNRNGIYNNQVQYGLGMQQLGTQQTLYNNTVTTNTVNSTAILGALQRLYTQLTLLQSSYGTNPAIGTQIIGLNTVIQNCVNNPTQLQMLNQLPIICKHIMTIYYLLNQLRAGAQITNLAKEFSNLFFCCLGINSQ